MNASILLIGLALLHSCCDERIEQQERSPAGDKLAVVTYRSCGVLGGDGTNVTLRIGKSEDLVVRADGHHAFIAIWKDETTLKIFVPETAPMWSIQHMEDAYAVASGIPPDITAREAAEAFVRWLFSAPREPDDEVILKILLRDES